MTTAENTPEGTSEKASETDTQLRFRVVFGDQMLFTTSEVARVLHLSRTTVYTLINDGSIRPVHIGRSCRITRAELDRFVGGLDAA
jgi:excisionase family DNA binding protein